MRVQLFFYITSLVRSLPRHEHTLCEQMQDCLFFSAVSFINYHTTKTCTTCLVMTFITWASNFILKWKFICVSVFVIKIGIDLNFWSQHIKMHKWIFSWYGFTSRMTQSKVLLYYHFQSQTWNIILKMTLLTQAFIFYILIFNPKHSILWPFSPLIMHDTFLAFQFF